jgi:formylglycine-generating enzyme required for sulfatase activity
MRFIRFLERLLNDGVMGFLAVLGFGAAMAPSAAFHAMPGYPDGFADESLLGFISWCPANSGGQTHPVGAKAANSLGLHDLSGNVSEWVSDGLGNYPGDDQMDPAGPSSGKYRVFRGGSWEGPSTCSLRSSARDASPPSYADRTYGFRVARNP